MSRIHSRRPPLRERARLYITPGSVNAVFGLLVCVAVSLVLWGVLVMLFWLVALR